MTFAELGAVLRAEREKRHWTIEDVASQLKINPRLILALEAGDGQALPHPSYARGFIRSYARLLGIGNDEIQAWLSELEPGDLKKPKPEPVSSTDYLPPPEPKVRRSHKGVWALLLIACLAGAGWWAWDTGQFSLPTLKKEKPADLVKNLPGADSYVAARPEPAPAAPPRPVLAPVDIPEPAPEPVRQARRAEPPAADPARQTPEPAREARAEEAQGSAPEQHKLIIIATEECWVHSSADKTDTRQFSLRKGDTFALTFAKNLELKLGNAGGVRLRYDGNELPPAGTSGQVRTLTFPPKDN